MTPNRIISTFLIIFLVGCIKKSERLKNGLTKSANETIEYAIQIQEDSLDTVTKDTLLITTKIYGNNDELVKQYRESLFDKQQMQIEYLYNSDNQLKQEKITMSADSLPLLVNYLYKNSLIFQTRTIRDNKSEKFEQIETYFYNEDKTKKKSIMTQLYIDKISNDTINNSVVDAYYNKKENYDSTITRNPKRPKFKRKTTYKYNENELSEIQEFNHKDSLISSTSYQYKMDKFNNWIEKRILKNGILKTIVIREITYK